MENIYRTKDIGVASALIAAGRQLFRAEREGSVYWFLFEGLDECLSLDKDYWFGELPVNARFLLQARDQLMSIIHR